MGTKMVVQTKVVHWHAVWIPRIVHILLWTKPRRENQYHQTIPTRGRLHIYGTKLRVLHARGEDHGIHITWKAEKRVQHPPPQEGAASLGVASAGVLPDSAGRDQRQEGGNLEVNLFQ